MSTAAIRSSRAARVPTREAGASNRGLWVAVIAGLVTVEPYCFLGANATIRAGITIARECVIGGGAVIMKSTEARSVHAAPRAQVLAVTSDRLPGL